MRYFIAKYFQQASGKYNESVKIDDKIRRRDELEASIILDYKDRKIIKCRFDGELGDGKDFNTISNFYKSHYENVITGLEAKYEVLGDLLADAVAEVLAEPVEEVEEVEEIEVDKEEINDTK